MKKVFLVTSLLIASVATTTGSKAQNVYKCSGNTYSQIPCPDGLKMTPPEVPDRAQRMLSDQATARDKRTADEMEKTRLKQEQLDLKTNTPAPVKVKQKSSDRTSKTVSTKDFVAEAPGTKKAPVKKRKPKAD